MGELKSAARRAVMRAAKDYGLGWRIPRAYARAAEMPVDERKVLFLESSRADLPEAFKVIHARLAADPAFDVKFVSLGKHRVGMARYLANCVEAAREAATARLIVLCDASDVVSCLPLRPETRVVQLWHGCGAFKKFGMSTAELSYGLTRGEIERHPFHENLSFVTVSSPEVVWAYAEAMNLQGREHLIAPIGVSRTDLFFDEGFIGDAIAHVWHEVPQAIDRRVVLYAPTFRGSLTHAQAPAMPDLEQLRSAIGENSVLLVKHHPMVRDLPPIPDSCHGFAFDVTRALPIDELMTVADVMVTDYSSVVFEYSLMGRPMAFFAYDLDEYNDWRGFYYDYDEMTPGPVVRTTDELIDYLDNLDERFDAAEVEAFRQKFMCSCDGHATERICNLIVEP